MSRIRTVKPEYWAHHKVARVSRDARLLFLGLLNESDDEGRLVGSAKRIAGVVFPPDHDATARKVDRWLDEREEVGLIARYVINAAEYLWLPGFTEHQRVSHPAPSRLPAPPDDLPNPAGGPPEALRPDLGREWNGTGRAHSASARATRIPEEFTITPEMRAWATSKCRDIDLELHTQRFVNYFKAASGRNAAKLDWVRTWQNWLLKEQDAVPQWKRNR